MKTVNEKLEEWAVRKIERDFPDDICLLLDHKTLRLDKDEGKIGLESYVPNTPRSGGLARTFIIDGIGYDLFPHNWETLEKMADVNHYNLTCLDDASIIWARTEADRQRFESLKEKFRANLKNPHLMLQRAQSWLSSAAEIYLDMIFEKEVYKIRKHAGYFCDLLAIAISYTNGTYFHRGQNGQLAELRKLHSVPWGFIETYEKALFEKEPEVQKKHCQALLGIARDYLKSLTIAAPAPKRGASELASWYHELSYTFRRTRHYCEAGDAASAYLWGCMLQDEIGIIVNDYNIAEIDIMGAFDSGNPASLAERANQAERTIIAAIEAEGGTLDVYTDIDDFLEKNQ